MITFLQPHDEAEYHHFLENCSVSTFYHTWAYKKFLESILERSKSMYFIFKKEDRIMGCLPSFQKDTSLGACLNALPFYGSYGAPVVREDVTFEEKIFIKETLINAYLEYAGENCVSYNLIDNPFDENLHDVFPLFKKKITDYRISQMSQLPTNGDISFDNLTASFHHKTRNLVRKSLKIGFQLHESNNIIPLYELHKNNMQHIQGKEKPLHVLKNLLKNYEHKKDYDIYYAFKDGIVSACLLVFYYRQTVEYFTPAIHPLYRHEQPLLFLIYHAMQKAIQNNYSLWNWGGTWSSQEGVYHFKKRFGVIEKKYYYYHDQKFEPHILQSELLENFPFYYVKNFTEDA